MMKRYKNYIFMILSVLLVGGCVQEDLNEALRKEAEQNVRLGKLREWISNSNNEVQLLYTIVNTIPSHDYIESITELPDGSGTLIVFHKGGDILIKNGLPGDKGENGKDGIDGENGKDSTGGTNGKDGKDGQNGKDGEKGSAGDTPLLGAKQDADGNYYWTVQIGKGTVEWLKDEKNEKVIMTPTNGITPTIDIAKDLDGEYYWQVTIGTHISWMTGENGEKIVAGVDEKQSIFASVNLTDAEYVIFTMADGNVYKVPKAATSKLVFNETSPLFFRRGVSFNIPFDCSNFQQVVKTTGKWDATITYQAKATQGVLTVKAPATGSLLPASEKITIEGVDALGKKTQASIVVTLYHRIELPSFQTSQVYDILMEGRKVGEICKEYIPDYSTTERTTVIYSYNAISHTFGSGLILENGATIQHDGTGYKPTSGNPSSTAILTEDGSQYVMPTNDIYGLSNGVICSLKASLVTDIQGYAYRVVKIGKLYWMGENLKTTVFNDGSPIPANFDDDLAWMIQCGKTYPACLVDKSRDANALNAMQYRNLYGVLYNRFAMLGDIAPKGWHIPSEAELQALVDFVGADARKLKSIVTLNKIGNWKESPGIEGNNLTGFTALPANTIDGANGSFGPQEATGQWWSTNIAYRIQIDYQSNNIHKITSENLTTGEGNSIRCVQNENH